nr:hypothetical protein GCM10020092_058220 [Actinoplanes digitatis]
MSVPAQLAAIDRSTPMVRSAALALSQGAGLGVRRHARLVAFRAEAVHPDVGERPQVPGEIFDVHPGAAVNLRGYSRVRRSTRRPAPLALERESVTCAE